MDREVAGSSPAIRSDESLKAFGFETFLYSYSKTYVDISVAVAAENKKWRRSKAHEERRHEELHLESISLWAACKPLEADATAFT